MFFPPVAKVVVDKMFWMNADKLQISVISSLY